MRRSPRGPASCGNDTTGRRAVQARQQSRPIGAASGSIARVLGRSRLRADERYAFGRLDACSGVMPPKRPACLEDGTIHVPRRREQGRMAVGRPDASHG